MVVLLLFNVANTHGQTNFYSNSSGNVNVLATWGTATDGSGANPANFTTDNQVFNIRNNPTPTIGSNWTVAGTNSKIIVGDGINPINFTIPDTKAVNGLIDVNTQANLTNSSGSTLTLGSVSSNSTVIYNQGSAQNIVPVTYGNLTLGGTGNKSMGGNVTVLKTLTLNSGESLVISAGTLLTLSGSLINNGGGITGLATSSLNINSTTGISLSLPAISLQNLTIEAANTVILNGDLNLNGNLIINGIFDAGISEYQIRNGGSAAVQLSGKFITRDPEGFTGANASIPSTTVTINAGSTIEYARLGTQVVSSRNDYKNITFSGSGIKTLPTFTPIGTVTIKDNAIVDAANKNFGDSIATNLTMIGGRFIVAGTGTKPDIAGTYNLSGGVIEFAGGTTSSKQTIRYTGNYINIEITGSNVGNSLSDITLQNGGSFTVKTNGVYDNNARKIDGAAGTQTFIMEAGSTFKTGVGAGFSGTGSEALSNIETITIDPKSTIIYSRTTNQTITTSSGSYPTLLLRGGGIKTVTTGTLSIAATADSVVIDPSVTLKVSSGAKANFNNRPVTVHSSASGTGFIGEITDGSSALLNATNVTVERYIPARRAFRFLSAPVLTSSSIQTNWMEGQSNPAPAYSVNYNNYPGYGIHITGSSDASNGFDATITNNPSLFTFNNSSQAWQATPNTSSTLAPGVGYRLLIRGSRSVDLSNNSATPSNTILRAKGTLKTGTIVFDAISNPSIAGNTNNFSLIGNPYACPVNWDALTKPGLSSYYYVWDPNLNTRGAYAVYGFGSTNPASSQVDQNLQAGQAFFVQTTSVNPSLTFNEANKTTFGKNVFRTAFTLPTFSVQLLLDTTNEVQHTADGVTIFFDDSFKSEVGSEDAVKIGNLDENMSISRNGKLLSIERRPAVVSSDTIQLHFTQLRLNKYYLKLDGNNFPSSQTVIVKDNLLKKETAVDLSSGSVLPFSITSDSASFAPARFTIIFKSSQVLPVVITDIKVHKKGAGVQVDWLVSTQKGMDRYEVEKSANGRQFEKRATAAVRGNGDLPGTYSWYDEKTNTGNNFYRIKCIQKSGAIIYSKLAEVVISKITNPISISPNPIEGNQVNLRMQNVEKGIYRVAILNSNGQTIYSGIINYNGTATNFKLSLGKVMSKGVYTLQIGKGENMIIENVIFE